MLVLAPMLSSLVLDSNKKVTNWISTGMSSKKIKLFDTNLELTMSNLVNGKVILKLNNSSLVQKKISSLYSNFISNFYIVYKLNTWPRNPTNNFTLKNCFSGNCLFKLVRNAVKSNFTYNG